MYSKLKQKDFPSTDFILVLVEKVLKLKEGLEPWDFDRAIKIFVDEIYQEPVETMSKTHDPTSLKWTNKENNQNEKSAAQKEQKKTQRKENAETMRTASEKTQETQKREELTTEKTREIPKETEIIKENEQTDAQVIEGANEEKLPSQPPHKTESNENGENVLFDPFGSVTQEEFLNKTEGNSSGVHVNSSFPENPQTNQKGLDFSRVSRRETSRGFLIRSLARPRSLETREFHEMSKKVENYLEIPKNSVIFRDKLKVKESSQVFNEDRYGFIAHLSSDGAKIRKKKRYEDRLHEFAEVVQRYGGTMYRLNNRVTFGKKPKPLKFEEESDLIKSYLAIQEQPKKILESPKKTKAIQPKRPKKLNVPALLALKAKEPNGGMVRSIIIPSKKEILRRNQRGEGIGWKTHAEAPKLSRKGVGTPNKPAVWEKREWKSRSRDNSPENSKKNIREFLLGGKSIHDIQEEQKKHEKHEESPSARDEELLKLKSEEAVLALEFEREQRNQYSSENEMEEKTPKFLEFETKPSFDLKSLKKGTENSGENGQEEEKARKVITREESREFGEKEQETTRNYDGDCHCDQPSESENGMNLKDELPRVEEIGEEKSPETKEASGSLDQNEELAANERKGEQKEEEEPVHAKEEEPVPTREEEPAPANEELEAKMDGEEEGNENKNEEQEDDDDSSEFSGEMSEFMKQYQENINKFLSEKKKEEEKEKTKEIEGKKLEEKKEIVENQPNEKKYEKSGVHVEMSLNVNEKLREEFQNNEALEASRIEAQETSKADESFAYGSQFESSIMETNREPERKPKEQDDEEVAESKLIGMVDSKEEETKEIGQERTEEASGNIEKADGKEEESLIQKEEESEREMSKKFEKSKQETSENNEIDSEGGQETKENEQAFAVEEQEKSDGERERANVEENFENGKWDIEKNQENCEDDGENERREREEKNMRENEIHMSKDRDESTIKKNEDDFKEEPENISQAIHVKEEEYEASFENNSDVSNGEECQNEPNSEHQEVQSDHHEETEQDEPNSEEQLEQHEQMGNNDHDDVQDEHREQMELDEESKESQNAEDSLARFKERPNEGYSFQNEENFEEEKEEGSNSDDRKYQQDSSIQKEETFGSNSADPEQNSSTPRTTQREKENNESNFHNEERSMIISSEHSNQLGLTERSENRTIPSFNEIPKGPSIPRPQARGKNFGGNSNDDHSLLKSKSPEEFSGHFGMVKPEEESREETNNNVFFEKNEPALGAGEPDDVNEGNLAREEYDYEGFEEGSNESLVMIDNDEIKKEGNGHVNGENSKEPDDEYGEEFENEEEKEEASREEEEEEDGGVLFVGEGDQKEETLKDQGGPLEDDKKIEEEEEEYEDDFIE